MGEAEIISYEYLFYEVLYLDIPAEVYCIWVFLLKCIVFGFSCCNVLYLGFPAEVCCI